MLALQTVHGRVRVLNLLKALGQPMGVAEEVVGSLRLAFEGLLRTSFLARPPWESEAVAGGGGRDQRPLRLLANLTDCILHRLVHISNGRNTTDSEN